MLTGAPSRHRPSARRGRCDQRHPSPPACSRAADQDHAHPGQAHGPPWHPGAADRRDRDGDGARLSPRVPLPRCEEWGGCGEWDGAPSLPGGARRRAAARPVRCGQGVAGPSEPPPPPWANPAVRDLAPPGELLTQQAFTFSFDNVEMQHDSYLGLKARWQHVLEGGKRCGEWGSWDAWPPCFPWRRRACPRGGGFPLRRILPSSRRACPATPLPTLRLTRPGPAAVPAPRHRGSRSGPVHATRLSVLGPKLQPAAPPRRPHQGAAPGARGVARLRRAPSRHASPRGRGGGIFPADPGPASRASEQGTNSRRLRVTSPPHPPLPADGGGHRGLPAHRV